MNALLEAFAMVATTEVAIAILASAVYGMVIGALPGHPRVTVAATANGFTLGPLMGREAAHLALGGTARDGLEAFGFARFGA